MDSPLNVTTLNIAKNTGITKTKTTTTNRIQIIDVKLVANGGTTTAITATKIKVGNTKDTKTEIKTITPKLFYISPCGLRFAGVFLIINAITGTYQQSQPFKLFRSFSTIKFHLLCGK